MLNPFGSQSDRGSYVNLQKRLLQSVQSAMINEQIMGVIVDAYAAENIVLAQAERKRLFSQIIRLVSDDLTRKIADGSISV
jgi:hypothetical protein